MSAVRRLARLALPVALCGVAVVAATASPCGAATGDRWVWPGPPNENPADPAYYDARRGAASFCDWQDGSATWTVSPDTPATWNVSVAAAGGAPDRDQLGFAYDGAGDRLITLTAVFVEDDTCCTGAYRYGLMVEQLGPVASWSTFGVGLAAPTVRSGATVAYDSRRKRILVVGGHVSGSSEPTTDEIDAFDLSGNGTGWSTITPAPGGLARLPFTALYDSTTDRLLSVGSIDSMGYVQPTVSSLDLGAPGAWQSWNLGGPTAAPSIYLRLAKYDLDLPRRRLLYLREGYLGLTLDQSKPHDAATESAPDTTEVWSLPLDGQTGWTQVPYAGRAPVISQVQSVFDPEHDRYEVFGAGYRDDLIELRLDVGAPWTMRARSDFVPQGQDAVALLDAARGRTLALYFGDSRIWTVRRGTSADWELLAGDRPLVRHAYGAYAFDSQERCGYVFGGTEGDIESELGDLWRFALDDTDHVTWTRLFPEGESPSPRWGAFSVYDPVRHRIVLFGGWAGREVGDTWELRLDPPVRWRRIPDRGVVPSPRYWGSAVYDSRRDAMIINGGLLGYLWDRRLTDETWVLSFADGDVWEPLTAFGRQPAPRYLHSAVYDSRRDRMLVLWGYAYNAGRIDCAELDLANGPTWTAYDATGLAPQSRGEFGAVYDPVRDDVLCVGGMRGADNPTYFPPNQVIDFSANPVQSPPPLTGPPLALLGFAPNPTADVENVAFDLPTDADVHARFYDAAGRLVRDLGVKRYVAGRHLLVWDGKTTLGARAASGVYYARVSTLGKDFSGKFVLLH